MISTGLITPSAVLARLRPGMGASQGEWAFLDLREQGEAAEGHAFASVNLPYSVLELHIAQKIPRLDTPIVLIDGANGVAARAARHLHELGYRHIEIVQGGVPAWQQDGLPLFKGVHSWSKAFGEWVQHRNNIPEIGPEELAQRMNGPDAPLLLDVRPLAEHRVFTLPKSQNCPNGELALRAHMVPPERPIVVHCAGRTRSIIGAQTLLDLGLPNPVYALRDGTQGWEIAGFSREKGANRPFAPDSMADAQAQHSARARLLAEGVPCIDTPTLQHWWADASRTTYLFDPRPDDDGPIAPCFIQAPATTLIQQTDQFIAVKNARVVIWDSQLPRAAFAAIWLHRMGHEVAVLEGDPTGFKRRAPHEFDMPLHLAAPALGLYLRQGAQVIDLRPYSAFAAQRLQQARRVPRPALASLSINAPIVLACDLPAKAALAARDLILMGHKVLGYATPSDWENTDLPLDTLPPPHDARTDEVRFCGGRHAGSLDDARAYLAWETGLLAQLDAAGLSPWPANPH